MLLSLNALKFMSGIMTSAITNAFTVSTAAFHVAQYQWCVFFSALWVCTKTITYNI